MRKSVTIILIVFLLLIIIGTSTLFVMLLNGNLRIKGLRFNIGNSYVKEIAIDESYDNKFDMIKINTTSGDINIYESEDENIKLVIHNKKERTTVSTDNNILNIDVKAKKCNFLCFNPKIAKIDLYIPSSYDKDIKIVTQYGDIKAKSFENANFDIKGNYGDIKINKINNAKLDLDYGDIKIDSVNELIVNSNYGDIEVKEINGYLDINCDYGDVELKTVNLTKNSTIKDDFGDVEIKHINGVYIDAKTDLGDKDIKGNDRTSDITLTIKVDCGDIEVN